MQSVRGAWGLDKPGSGQAQPMANPFADNPFTKAFQEMLAGNFGQPGTGKPGANPYAEALNGIFDSGLEVQKAYQKNMESIFDTYFKGEAPEDSAAPRTEKHTSELP